MAGPQTDGSPRQLTDLPNELLTEIFSHLPCDRGLTHVALVSHRFTDLVKPFIYRTITFNPRKKCSHQAAAIDYYCEVFNNIIHRLSQDSILRSYVRNLSWFFSGSHPFADEGVIRLFNVLPGLQTLAINRPTSSALLVKQTHLESVVLNPGQFRCDKPDVAARSFTRIVQAAIAQYLSLPSLRHLDVDFFTYDLGQHTHFVPQNLEHISQITSLGYHRYWTESMSSVSGILFATKSLQRLTIDVEMATGLVNANRIATSLGSLGCSLRFHATSLTELNIAFSAGVVIPDSLLEHGLVHFCSLRRLAIPERLLVNPSDQSLHQTLPPGLEELQLQYISHGTKEERKAQRERLRKLAENKRVYSPSLRRLVRWDHNWSYEFRHPSLDRAEKILDAISFFDTFHIAFERVWEGVFVNTPFGRRQQEEANEVGGVQSFAILKLTVVVESSADHSRHYIQEMATQCLSLR
jgi:hypothetical protein